MERVQEEQEKAEQRIAQYEKMQKEPCFVCESRIGEYAREQRELLKI